MTHEYTYASGKLLREVITTTADGTSTTQTLDFFYDSNGTPYAISVDGTVYYYITNLQGDVMSVVDGSGTVVARYEYDPFGAVISATGDLAEINPLRYRGYYYDAESGLFYLQSRYYDPATCRFINADGYASTGQGIIGYNMFAYCNNDPENCFDPSGCSTLSEFSFAQAERSGGFSYITDQNSPAVAKKRYGLATVSHSGCGPIATYNALISLGNPRPFSEVLSYYNRNFFQLSVGGLAGTSPDLVAQYFQDYGYTVYMTNDPYEIDVYSQSADACILWYMFPATYEPLGVPINAFGAHFVEYSKGTTGYIGRNTGGAGTYQFTYPSDYAYQGPRYYAIGIFIYK